MGVTRAKILFLGENNLDINHWEKLCCGKMVSNELTYKTKNDGVTQGFELFIGNFGVSPLNPIL